jgi:hypothetical protein
MRDRSAVQSVAMLFGVVFLLVGILGFIPGITSNYDEMAFAGEDSRAELLGIFQVSILHNIVHLLFGIAGLALARTYEGARTYMIGGGVIYLALWILGLVGGGDWIPANDADHWLHFALGVVMIGLGFLTSRERATTTTAAA